jgi:hypothetical protein
MQTTATGFPNCFEYEKTPKGEAWRWSSCRSAFSMTPKGCIKIEEFLRNVSHHQLSGKALLIVDAHRVQPNPPS